jgi:hypothetical protein
MDETYNDATTELVGIAMESATKAFWDVADRLYADKFAARRDVKVDAAEAHEVVGAAFTNIGGQLATFFKRQDPEPMTWEVAEKVLGSLGADTLQMLELFINDEDCSTDEYSDVLDLVAELNGAATHLHHKVATHLDK